MFPRWLCHIFNKTLFCFWKQKTELFLSCTTEKRSLTFWGSRKELVIGVVRQSMSHEKNNGAECPQQSSDKTLYFLTIKFVCSITATCKTNTTQNFEPEWWNPGAHDVVSPCNQLVGTTPVLTEVFDHDKQQQTMETNRVFQMIHC